MFSCTFVLCRVMTCAEIPIVLSLITAQDIKMKFFNFNLTPIGIILHKMTVLINVRCCHDNLLCYECVVEQKSEKTCIFARILA